MTGPPDTSVADLTGELLHRLLGEKSPPRLPEPLAQAIPEARSYVLILFDGLGTAQLEHPAAQAFRRSTRGTISSPFPTTTSVALSSLVTAAPPRFHGLTSHLMWLPKVDNVVNTLKWVDLTGAAVPYDYPGVLPGPNLWERLRDGGVEPITVQPGPFQGSPLSRLLYRGARFEPAWDDRDLVEATISLAGSDRRFILTYVWQVDFAGHVHGLESAEFAGAMQYAAGVWETLVSRLPGDVALIGTADHGLIEYADSDKVVIRDGRFSNLRFAGDARGIQVWGEEHLVAEFAGSTGGSIHGAAELYGGETPAHVSPTIVLAPKGKVILPPGFDKRLRAYHGGLEPAEVEVPLLVG